MHEPARRFQRCNLRAALQDYLPIGTDKANEPVSTDVELRRQRQFHEREVAFFLGQHLRDCCGAVAVVKAQLGLQGGSTRPHMDDHATGKREQYGTKQQQPDLAIQ